MPVKLKSVSSISARLGIDSDGRVIKFLTQTCAKHIDKYVPYREGNLASYKISDNLIKYEQPYAKYQYYGISKYGKPLHYSTDKHPLANNYWDKRMVSAEMQDVISEVQDYIKRGG